MTKFSTKVKFINTCHPHLRDGLMKGNQEELREDESIFHLSCHQYYENRPENSPYDSVDWDNMSLAEFISNYEYSKVCSKSSQSLLNDEGYLHERTKPAVLRYFLNYDDPEDFARGLLILFYPFRNEMEDIHSLDVYELLNEYKQDIEEKRKLFEKGIDLTELINEVENLREEKADEENDGEIEEQLIMEETTSEFDIEKFIVDAKKSASKLLSRNNEDKSTPEIEDIRKGIMSLNSQQRRIFDDITERLSSLDTEEKPLYLYIAGEAGTGKSYL